MTNSNLFELILRNTCISKVLETVASIELDHWYVGAGAVCQTVWNIRHGYDPTEFIKDIDVVYFDSSNLSADAEQELSDMANQSLMNLKIPVEFTNQARVHMWYENEFGFEIDPYDSTEDAIATWPTTASAIGVRLTSKRDLKVCAPFGLDDIDKLIVRPNKKLVTQSIYEAKANRWKKHWPKLKVIPW